MKQIIGRKVLPGSGLDEMGYAGYIASPCNHVQAIGVSADILAYEACSYEIAPKADSVLHVNRTIMFS